MLQRLLGHVNAALSLELYARGVMAQERLVVEKLGAKFAPKLHPAVIQ